MKKIVYLLPLFVFLFSGCSQKLELLPEVKNKEAMGTLTIIRENNLFGYAFSVYFVLNGKTVTYLGSNQYTKFKLPSGDYESHLKSTGQFFITTNSDSINFTISNNENKYIYIKPQLGVSNFGLKLIDESDALNYIDGNETVYVAP